MIYFYLVVASCRVEEGGGIDDGVERERVGPYGVCGLDLHCHAPLSAAIQKSKGDPGAKPLDLKSLPTSPPLRAHLLSMGGRLQKEEFWGIIVGLWQGTGYEFKGGILFTIPHF
jgi:hypothetical protein